MFLCNFCMNCTTSLSNVCMHIKYPDLSRMVVLYAFVSASMQKLVQFLFCSISNEKCHGHGTASLGKVNRPTMFFYLAVATSTAKISLGRNVSIFMKRETLQKRHKQSNKHVFRVCMHSYMYITKVT